MTSAFKELCIEGQIPPWRHLADFAEMEYPEIFAGLSASEALDKEGFWMVDNRDVLQRWLQPVRRRVPRILVRDSEGAVRLRAAVEAAESSLGSRRLTDQGNNGGQGNAVNGGVPPGADAGGSREREGVLAENMFAGLVDEGAGEEPNWEDWEPEEDGGLQGGEREEGEGDWPGRGDDGNAPMAEGILLLSLRFILELVN